jgi:hypothetical protein
METVVAAQEQLIEVEVVPAAEPERCPAAEKTTFRPDDRNRMLLMSRACGKLVPEDHLARFLSGLVARR